MHFQTVFTCLGVWLHLIWIINYAFYPTMKVYNIYIYCREIYTIIYCIWHTRASWDTSQVRAQCLPLFLQGGWGGQLWLLGGAAPIVFQLLIRGMSLLVLARIGVRVMRPGRRRICGSLVFDANGPGPWGPAPLGKSGVHRNTRCPSLLSALRRSVC